MPHKTHSPLFSFPILIEYITQYPRIHHITLYSIPALSARTEIIFQPNTININKLNKTTLLHNTISRLRSCGGGMVGFDRRCRVVVANTRASTPQVAPTPPNGEHTQHTTISATRWRHRQECTTRYIHHIIYHLWLCTYVFSLVSASPIAHKFGTNTHFSSTIVPIFSEKSPPFCNRSARTFDNKPKHQNLECTAKHRQQQQCEKSREM